MDTALSAGRRSSIEKIEDTVASNIRFSSFKMDAILSLAIPWALDFVAPRVDVAEVRALQSAARVSGRVMHELCTFDWDENILDPNADPASNAVHVLQLVNIMALPEFKERLGNLLSKRGVATATVHSPEHDYKVDGEGDIVLSDAYLLVEFTQWRDDVVYSDCLPVGEEEKHVKTKCGVCMFCGSRALTA
jgi:hypothetical protein